MRPAQVPHRELGMTVAASWCESPSPAPDSDSGLALYVSPCSMPESAQVRAALTSCNAADAPMLRFVFGATVQPLLADVMRWAHSLSTPPAALLAPHAPAHSDEARGEDCESSVAVLLHSALHLPAFLSGVRHEIHLAGCQLRFLASLPACRGACAALERSAVQQAALVRSFAASDAAAPSTVLCGSRSSDSGSVGWRFPLAWDWEGAVRLADVFEAAQAERRALVQGLLDDLVAQRAASQDAERAEALRAVQARQAEALAEEQRMEAARVAEAERKLQLLREQQAALDGREHARRVRSQTTRGLKLAL